MRRLILVLLLIPLPAFAWQARVWPEIRDAPSLVKFTKEKTAVREHYLTKDRKLDFAFFPEEEWPKILSDMKPEAVLVERGYILIALMFGPQFTQAIAVISDEAAFKKDESAWITEATGDRRIKHVYSKQK